MAQTVALHTLGCKLNFSETSAVGNEFLRNGFSIVDFKEKADVYVLNTCTVTQRAEKDCRQFVRKTLRQNPEAYIIVTGCYAQLRPEEIANIEGVDVILGSNEKFKLFSLIDNFRKRNLACIFVSPADKLNDFGPAHSTDADTRTRAYFKIQDGCDYKCSFCTIPLARGLSRSMNPDDVIIQFKNLVDAGYKEIILTGVNVGDYGKSFSTNLFKLLLKLVDVEGDFRIRISSIEPNLLSDEIIELTASHEKMCRHFHIPLQSGSPEVLKQMKRRYKVENYSELIFKCIERIPEIGVGVDVIVGFPGETEEYFMETYNFLNELPVSYLHVFTYSERPDTKAIEFPGAVEVYERRKRNNMLRILSEKKRYNFYKYMIGKDLDVLFENENIHGKMKGFSSNYIRVSQDYNPNLINRIVTVSVDNIEDNYCIGTIKGTKNSIELIAS
ncbi:MAG TPA: tRNA (N(6)-L-threonylcarbamoyladenosine(37)-C(2))-methylthiotransferase MtaB [Ignavibacteriaceae bacterium]